MISQQIIVYIPYARNMQAEMASWEKPSKFHEKVSHSIHEAKKKPW
jgi:hypothetical protein